MQWNIGGAKIRKYFNDPTDTYLYVYEGFDYVQNILASSHSDIISLQEVHTSTKNNQAQDLAKYLQFPFWVSDTYSRSHIKSNQYLSTAILSKFPLSHHVFDLFYNPKYKDIGPKGEEWTSHDKGISRAIATLQKGKKLEIQTLHLTPFHRFHIDPLGEEAKKVRLDVEAKIKNDCPKLLLQGDFNIDTPSLRPFLPKLFADKMKQVILKTPTTPKGKWYDHILYKGFHHLQSYVITDVLTDHFPIYSEFEV
ncbi:hypothetical protein A3A59_00090 [Candidatus Gottesmanbacteria bacterium RIFCSPLOWO2_01_FULL_42_10]|nr:MAG: hypothetical protein A2699_01765 [Candidatus Gottesmanbacteria bacterium RIFCSPHIGHO2_01_FULL_43_15]OGG27709.1 MAG: hypothetical protein A3A59_00090 [Candidatus Gottesmanbacteria bacterium RIFCSPLOWO2_01_FULL_42_10]